MLKLITVTFVFLLSFPVLAESDDWRKVASEDKIDVYTRKSDSRVLPFKAEGMVEANIEIVLGILKDYKKKNEWSPKLKSVTLHEQLDQTNYIFSEYYKTPWPASDREFLLKGGIEKVSEGHYHLFAKSIEDESLADSDHIAADVKKISVSIKEVSFNQTKLEFEFHGDMKGWMPVWLMNIIQKKWPLRFIQGLREQAEKQRKVAKK